MARSRVRLPDAVDAYDGFEVYLNGVGQRQDPDYALDGRTLVFDRLLRKDRISALIADVDGVVSPVGADPPAGQPRLAHNLPIMSDGDPAADAWPLNTLRHARRRQRPVARTSVPR